MAHLIADIEKAADALAVGGVVAIPTETVYGLAARVDRPEAIEQIFRVKKRPHFDPLIVHISDIEQSTTIVKDFPPLARLLANQFWPGPLTIVLPKRDELNSQITSGLETVALRMPSHPVARELIQVSGPLAAPSANLFGKTSPTTEEHVLSEFAESSIPVLTGGACEVGIESTVLRIEGKKLTLLRPGIIDEKKLKQLILSWDSEVEIECESNQHSPGFLKDHYMPSIPLVLINGEEQVQKALEEGCVRGQGVEFTLNSDPIFAARELYGKMRDLSTKGDFIYVKNPRGEGREAGGPWSAIWDRLEKAASHNFLL